MAYIKIYAPKSGIFVKTQRISVSFDTAEHLFENFGEQ